MRLWQAIPFYTARFFIAALNQMSLIAAAIVYASMGPSSSTSTILGTPVREYTIALGIASAALLALGSALNFTKNQRLWLLLRRLRSSFRC